MAHIAIIGLLMRVDSRNRIVGQHAGTGEKFSINNDAILHFDYFDLPVSEPINANQALAVLKMSCSRLMCTG